MTKVRWKRENCRGKVGGRETARRSNFRRPHTLFSRGIRIRVRACVFGSTNTYAIAEHMRVSARREGRGCRIAGRGLVFTLISHRVSRGCQTLRPPPCGAPSFHRIRASRVPIPPLLFPSCIFSFSRLVPRTMTTLPNCARRSSCAKAVTIFVTL